MRLTGLPEVAHQAGNMDVRGYGVKLKISADRDVEPNEVMEAVGEVMSGIAVDCMERGAVTIGHVKSYLKAQSGFVKSDTIGPKYGVNVQGELKGPVRSASFVLNAIIVGLNREAIREISLRSAQEILAKHGFYVNTEENHAHSNGGYG